MPLSVLPGWSTYCQQCTRFLGRAQAQGLEDMQAGAAKSERVRVIKHSPDQFASCTTLQMWRGLERMITQLRLLIIVQNRCVWKLPEYLMPRADVLLC
jgi:hypothetical protein